MSCTISSQVVLIGIGLIDRLLGSKRPGFLPILPIVVKIRYNQLMPSMIEKKGVLHPDKPWLRFLAMSLRDEHKEKRNF
jgi:hypothetical protein